MKNNNLIDPQQLMLTLHNHVDDAIYFKDRASRFLFVNDALARALRAPSVEDVLGRTDFDFFSSEHANAAYEIEQEILRTGKPAVNIEDKESFTDGTIQWSSTSKYPLMDADGAIVGTFGISRDITARKLSEAKMAQLQEELLRKERQLAVRDFADVILYHASQMAVMAGVAIDRVDALMEGGRFTAIKQEAERMIYLLPNHSSALDPSISLLGEIEIEAEQQAATRVELQELKKQLHGIIELVETRVHQPTSPKAAANKRKRYPMI